MNATLRLATLVALAVAAIAAQAQVTYSFAGTDPVLGQPLAFTATRDAFVAADTLVPRGGLTTATNVDRVQFLTEGVGEATRLDLYRSPSTNVRFSFQFGPEAFAADGTYRSEQGDGTLTVSGQPVPEPASFAALGVGAIGLLRRRRRKGA